MAERRLQLVESVGSIPDLLAASVRTWPDRQALWRWSGGRFQPLSYAQLRATTTALAVRLAGYGAASDRRVAIWVPDRFTWGVTYLAVLQTGATAVPIDPALTPPEIAGILAESEASLLIADAHCPPESVPNSSVPVIRIQDIWPELDASESGTVLDAAKIDPPTPAMILFTSGTTGCSKGVVLTHANIVSDIAAIRMMNLLDHEDVMLSILPIHHAFECTAGFLYPLAIGAQVAFARSLKSNEVMEDLHLTRATVMLGVPLFFEKLQKGIRRRIGEADWLRKFMFVALSTIVRGAQAVGIRRAGRVLFWPLRRAAGLDGIRILVSGGAALPAEVAELFDRVGLPLVQGYGLSEACPVVTVNRPGAHRYDTCGPPLPTVEVAIRNQRPDGIGEVAVRGPIVMKGYWRKPVETAAVLSDGWLLTGDLGSIDPDGHLRIVGRSKNVIISGAGKNVYPEEIEAVLGAEPEIAESVVYGLTRPGKTGEQVAAIIVPDFEGLALSLPRALEDEAVLRSCVDMAVRRACERMAPFKRITEGTPT